MRKIEREISAKTVIELKVRIQEIWDNLKITECQKLVDDMSQRTKVVIKAKGHVTPY